MQIIIPRKVDKYLEKQGNGDPKGVRKIRTFLWNYLSIAENPTALPNCKKMESYENTWRWRVGQYRIIGEVKTQELTIKLVKISTREGAY